MPTTPGDIGMSSQGLERARAHVESSVQRGEIAGAVVLAARHDQVAQLACIGLRDIEAGLPMEADTIFCIASMTKPIVSVGILQLVEAGKVRLDDPVSRYVPEFADARVCAGVEDGQVELAPLEGPIRSPPADAHFRAVRRSAASGARARLRQPGGFPVRAAGSDQPARRTTTGAPAGSRLAIRLVACVLGRIIEVAAELPLDEYLASATFAPLDMVDSGFYVPP